MSDIDDFSLQSSSESHHVRGRYSTASSSKKKKSVAEEEVPLVVQVLRDSSIRTNHTRSLNRENDEDRTELEQMRIANTARIDPRLIESLNIDFDMALSQVTECGHHREGNVVKRVKLRNKSKNNGMTNTSSKPRSLWMDESGRDIEDIEQQFRREKLRQFESRVASALPDSARNKGVEANDSDKIAGNISIFPKSTQAHNHGGEVDDKSNVGATETIQQASAVDQKKNTEEDEIEKSQKKQPKVNKTKQKLMNLNKFVMSHTTRKVKSGWDFVDNKFMSSNTHKTVLVKDSSGISNPMRVKTVQLSTLTTVLCSIQVQLNQKQLIQLYENLGIREHTTLNSCRIAARKLIQNTSADASTQQLCAEEIASLSLLGDPFIAFEDFKDIIFSKDPDERAREFRVIEKERSERVALLYEEKKRKRETMQKAEARKNKAMYEFENTLSAIQYARGSLTKERFHRFQDLIAHCHRTIIEDYYSSIVSVNPAVVELIGEDLFPDLKETYVDPFRKGATQEEFLQALRRSGVETTVKRSEAYRVDLVGSPTLINVLRKTVSLGKGLYGMSYADVAELLQCYAATVIAAVYQGHRKRWRYHAARRLWKQMFFFMKSKVFFAWQKDARYCVMVRKHCLRKFVAWKYFTHRAAYRRHLFRSCFWPFFVWRRTSIEEARAREKTRFLVSRVLPTAQLLHVFRAWKGMYLQERSYSRPSMQFYKQKREQYCQYQFTWWRYWTRRRKGLRRAWLRKGYLMLLSKKEEFLRLPLQLWYAATMFKKRLRNAIKHNAYHIRNFLLPNSAPQLPHHAKRIKLSKENKKRYLASNPPPELQESAQKSVLSKHGTLESRKFVKIQRCLRRASTMNDVEKKKHQRSSEKEEATVRRAPVVFKVYKPLPEISWQPDKDFFDVTSSSDDESFTSESVYSLYSQYKDECHDDYYEVHCFGEDHGFEFKKLSSEAKERIDRLQQRFYEVEVDMFLTCGFMYHRVAHHSFVNLRRYAIYSRNARKTKNQYNRRLMKRVLDGLVRWANRGIRENLEEGSSSRRDGVEVTMSEKLAFECRSERMEKLKRRRAAAEYYKQKEIKLKELERQHNIIPKVEEEEKMDGHARARMRRFSAAYQRVCPSKRNHSEPLKAMKKGKAQLLSSLKIIREGSSESNTNTGSNNDSDKTTGNDNQSKDRIEATPKAPKSSSELFSEELTTSDSAVYENVDMLDWDREERDQEMALMQQMVRYGSEMSSSAAETAVQCARDSAGVEATAKFREEVIGGILDFESKRTDAALSREFQFVSEFKIKMARNMVDVLCKIHEEVKFFLLCQEKRQYFRRLRLPLLIKRSLAMVNYKKIANWIRICRRLGAMYEKAPFYRQMKTKWIIFNRWLKSFEKDTLDCSPGLIAALKSRAALRNDFSQMLKDRRFVKTCYPRASRLRECSHDSTALFLRWKEFTQDCIMFRMLDENVVKLHRIRVLQKCFWCLKTNISILESYEDRKIRFSYAYTRTWQDCDQISKRFMCRRRRSLSFALRKYQRRSQFLMKREGLKALSFKRFVSDTINDIAERTMLEQILLLTAFERRGELVHKDIRVKSEQPAVEGVRFSEPKPFRLNSPPCIAKEGVPAGYTLSKIRVAIQAGMGLIGFQCFWGATAARSIESKIRGKMFGGGIINSDFVIPPGDFLMDVEYICEGNALIGIRFKTFFQPWSRWIGKKATKLSKRYMMSANDASLDPQDAHLEYKSGGIKEDQYPGVPQQYIIGFGGVETAARITCLHVIVRKVTSQHVFSYSWVQSVQEEDEEDNDEEAPNSPAGSQDSSRSGSRLPPLVPKDEATQREELRNQMLSRFHKLGDESAADEDVHELEVKEVSLSSAEEQFFDVIRMRAVEVKAAEARALKFARSVWKSMDLRMHESLSVATEIGVLSGLTRWFLEGLCKSLVKMPEDRDLADKLSEDMHQNRLDLENIDSVLKADEGNIQAKKAEAAQQPWFNRSLLSPAMRAMKKTYQAELKALVGVLEKSKEEKQRLLTRKEQLRIKSEVHLPHIQLTIGVINNMNLKIKASAYKRHLLQSMPLETLKSQLGGVSEQAYHFKLSEVALERIREGKARVRQPQDQVARLLQEEEAGGAGEEERLRQSRLLYGERPSTDIDPDELASELLQMWRPPSRGALHEAKNKDFHEEPERVLMSQDFTFQPSKAKTFRKSHAVNPIGGVQPRRASQQSRSKTRDRSLALSQSLSGLGSGWNQPGGVTQSGTFLPPRASLSKVVISRGHATS